MAGFDINFGALQPLNPLAAVDYYDYGQKQQRRKREDAAYQRYATDPKGGIDDLMAVDPKTALALRSDNRAQATADREAQKEADKEQFEFTKSAATILARRRKSYGDAPDAADRFAQDFDRLSTFFDDMPGYTAESMEALKQQAMQDPSILDVISRDADEKLKFFNTKQGVVGVDPVSGEGEMAYQLPEDPLDAELKRALIQQRLSSSGAADARAAKTRATPVGGRGRSRSRASGRPLGAQLNPNDGW